MVNVWSQNYRAHTSCQSKTYRYVEAGCCNLPLCRSNLDISVIATRVGVTRL